MSTHTCLQDCHIHIYNITPRSFHTTIPNGGWPLGVRISFIFSNNFELAYKNTNPNDREYEINHRGRTKGIEQFSMHESLNIIKNKLINTSKTIFNGCDTEEIYAILNDFVNIIITVETILNDSNEITPAQKIHLQYQEGSKINRRTRRRRGGKQTRRKQTHRKQIRRKQIRRKQIRRKQIRRKQIRRKQTRRKELLTNKNKKRQTMKKNKNSN